VPILEGHGALGKWGHGTGRWKSATSPACTARRIPMSGWSTMVCVTRSARPVRTALKYVQRLCRFAGESSRGHELLGSRLRGSDHESLLGVSLASLWKQVLSL